MDGLPEAVGKLRDEVRESREAVRRQTLKAGLEGVGELVEGAESIDGAKVVTGKVVVSDVQGLRQISDDVKNRLGGPSAVVLAADLGGKAVMIANIHPEVSRKVKAGDLVKEASSVLGGGGGGSPTMAQAGGGDLAAIPEALSRVKDILSRELSGKSAG